MVSTTSVNGLFVTVQQPPQAQPGQLMGGAMQMTPEQQAFYGMAPPTAAQQQASNALQAQSRAIPSLNPYGLPIGQTPPGMRTGGMGMPMSGPPQQQQQFTPQFIQAFLGHLQQNPHLLQQFMQQQQQRPPMMGYR
jgi:hypothetical protein